MHSNFRTTNYLSFKSSKHYDEPPKVGFESNLKPYSSSILQFDAYSANRVYDKKTSSISNIAFVGTTDLRSASKPTECSAQLTIFYAGSVRVFDDVTPEKAQAIMVLAGNGNNPKNPPKNTPTSTIATPKNINALPQARKASLARFMEKRKERAITVAPYPIHVKQSLECGTHGSESRSFSITSTGSFSLSFTK